MRWKNDKSVCSIIKSWMNGGTLEQTEQSQQIIYQGKNKGTMLL